MSYRPEDYAFAVVGEHVDGRLRNVARYTCSKCPATFDITLRRGTTLEPEPIAKHARRAGWEIGTRASAHRCPDCQRRGKGRQAIIEAALSKGMERVETAAPPTPAPPTTEAPKENPMASSATPLKPAGALPRDPTSAERVKIRGLLDKHFDDASGCYLDGYSDQRVGAEVGVPWAIVAKMREAAYGPIRVDPELQALRADIGRFKAEAEAMTGKARDLEARLAALEKKAAAS